MRIGVIREDKNPPDSRVALTPEQCAFLRERHKAELVVQRSEVRCYKDEEYEALGVPVVEDVADCDVLIGVKEVPIESLIPEKTYFFFSHTIKKQAHNRELLRAVLRNRIRLIDYEVLTDAAGNRLSAFGFFAGMVGAHNALWTYGKRTKLFELPRMKDASGYHEIRESYPKVLWPPVKIILTGKGRVGSGAAKVLGEMRIRQVSPDEFLKETYNVPVYAQIDYDEYARPRETARTDAPDFFLNPEEFESDFGRFAAASDIMINGIYWDGRAPRFFTKAEMKESGFRIQVIADVTCDIAPDSSIPSTLRATTIDDPVFGYDPVQERETAPHREGVIDMMTVDNLPGELPRDASTAFGEQFLKYIWPEIEAHGFERGVLLRGTVAAGGELGENFRYLEDYVRGEEETPE